MELSDLKPKETVLEMKHPRTGEELGISITIMGFNDPRMKNIRKQFANEEFQRQRRNKADTANDAEKRGRKLCWNAMLGWEWRGDATFHGEKPEFTEKSFNDIIEELEWFGSQIDTFITEERNFL